MGRRRRRLDGALKSRAALDAVRGLKTVSELAALHKVHPTQTAPWKKQLLDGTAGVFDSCFSGKSFGWKADSAELYKQIGRLPASRALPIGGVI